MFAAYGRVERREVHQRRESQQHRGHTLAADPPPPTGSAIDVEKILERWIGKRTGGRIRSLKVHILGEGMVLRGWTSSYHVVQLAIAGLFDACRALNLDRPDGVELDLDVLPNGPSGSLATERGSETLR